MKKLMKMFGLMMVLTLVLAACAQAIEETPTPAASTDAMEEDAAMDKTDDMDEADAMDKEEDMDKHADDMDKEGAMDKEEDMDKAEDMSMMNEGSAAPAFSLMNLDGETVSLADFEGEKVYVKYWASWCSICVGGLPEIDELAGMSEGYQVVTIVTPNYLGEKSVEDFKEWFGMKDTKNLTVLLDVDGVYAKQFGVRGLPTSAYIGSDGVLVKVAPGHAGNDQINASFEEIY